METLLSSLDVLFGFALLVQIAQSTGLNPLLFPFVTTHYGLRSRSSFGDEQSRTIRRHRLLLLARGDSAPLRPSA